MNYRIKILLSIIGSWLTEIGIIKYQPEKWGAKKWELAYSKNTVDYYSDLKEYSRYSIIEGYLHYLIKTKYQAPNNKVKILDVGCGPGILYDRCRNLNFTSWTGLDLSTTAISDANNLISSKDRSEVAFTEQDALKDEGDWSNKKYDVIIINEVLYVCDDPSLLLTLLSNKLNSDGYFIISIWKTPGTNQIWKLIDKFNHTIDSVQVISSTSMEAKQGWKVALLQPRK